MKLKQPFIGIDMLQEIFAILPGEPVELGAGYAFSAVEGTALCLIGDARVTVLSAASLKNNK